MPVFFFLHCKTSFLFLFHPRVMRRGLWGAQTHHNDTALVRKLRDEGKIVEPLKDYHKDEVPT